MESPEVGRNYINVRRGHVLDDGISKMSRSRFNPKLPLSVKFAHDGGISEGAVDTGGPTREFFRLAIREMFQKSSIFGGAEGNKVLIHNIQGKPLQMIYLTFLQILKAKVQPAVCRLYPIIVARASSCFLVGEIA